MQMMTSRREMLGHAAGMLTGLAFVGCGLVRLALSQTPQRRREVVVNGKRVRTVDVHAHCHVPEANALMDLRVQQPSLVISSERVKTMDEQGIDVEALSGRIRRRYRPPGRGVGSYPRLRRSFRLCERARC